MTTLQLRPLPSLRSNQDSDIRAAELDGFVDENAVLALVAGPVTHRDIPISAELALAADDMDFAGWCLPAAPSTPRCRFTPKKAIAAGPRPAPPMQDEPGLGVPHHGKHRWWLAGLAGALTTLLFSLLLLSLSSRPAPPSPSTETAPSPQESIARLSTSRPAAPLNVVPARLPAPQLTDIER